MFDTVVVLSIGRAVAIIPRPPNAEYCLPQLYLLASASDKPIAEFAFAVYRSNVAFNARRALRC